MNVSFATSVRHAAWALALGGLAAAGAWGIDAGAIAASNGPGVVAILGHRADTGATVQGSGCAVGLGHVLTTAHQVDGMADLVARFQDGSEQPLSVVAVDPVQGAALLRLPGDGPDVALGDARGLMPGTPLVALAGPETCGSPVIEGAIPGMELLSLWSEPVLLTTLPACEGASGGPVFDAEGLLVGVVLGAQEGAAGPMSVIPINNLYPLLQGRGLSLRHPLRSRDALLAYNEGIRSVAVEEKIAAYRRATRLMPEFYEAWFSLGEACAASRQHDAAVEAYTRAANLRPGETAAWRSLGHILLSLGRFDEAAASLERAAALEPGDSPTLNDWGESLRRAKRFDEAEGALRRALAADPDLARAWYNLALVHAQQGRDELAAQCLRRYLEASPEAADTAEIHEWLASLAVGAGESAVE